MTLRVKLEIVPFGEEHNTYEIGRLDIFNKGCIEFGHCEYGVIEFEPKLKYAGLFNKTIKHRRDLGAWALVKKVLEEKERTMNEQNIDLAQRDLPWENPTPAANPVFVQTAEDLQTPAEEAPVVI